MELHGHSFDARAAAPVPAATIGAANIVSHAEPAPMVRIAIVGAAAAIANAVFHATGKRIRNLPITPDKLLG